MLSNRAALLELLSQKLNTVMGTSSFECSSVGLQNEIAVRYSVITQIQPATFLPISRALTKNEESRILKTLGIMGAATHKQFQDGHVTQKEGKSFFNRYVVLQPQVLNFYDNIKHFEKIFEEVMKKEIALSQLPAASTTALSSSVSTETEFEKTSFPFCRKS